ncbi:MAG: FMN-binding protein [Deltaproteobacteria bacterium]|nr:FMN-binding protein [Deltaproteobacteria bacterium]
MGGRAARPIFLSCALLLLATSSAAAEVYLTKEQALAVALPQGCTPRYDPKDLSSELIERLEDARLMGEEQKQAHFFVCEDGAKPRGYALIDSEIGKHLPITYVVGISAEGRVTRVEMMVFREVRGWEAREQKFLHQFEGKGSSDKFKLGTEIENVTGATISAASMTKGVKRALLLWQEFYGNKGS